MRSVLRGLDALVRTSSLLACIALVGMVGVILTDVAKRALDMPPLAATNEIVQYMAMVLLVFFALPLTFWRAESISAPLIFDRLSPRLKREFGFISAVMVVVVMAGIGYYGYHEALRQKEFGEAGIISGYPLWWVRFALPVAAGLCIVAVVGQALARLTGNGDVAGTTADDESVAREGAL